jgi:DnaD/phage-associated family protein
VTKKLYTESESGGIRVISGRKIGEVRIPNYVYDLWLPLIGGDALTVYGVYCRLERGKTVRAITMRDIAKACRIGDKKLTEINAMLSACGFVVVRKPIGKARANHFTTEITTLNPPQQIAACLIEKYQIKSGYEPLSTWLLDEDSETSNGGSIETPNSVSGETPNDVSIRNAKQRVLEALDSVSTVVVTLDKLQPLLFATRKEQQLPPAEIQIQPPEKISDEPLPETPRIYAVFVENMRQQVTPIIADKLKDYVKELGEQWVEDAIVEAVTHNAKSWAYVETILNRWAKDGRNDTRTDDSKSNGKRDFLAKPQEQDGKRFISGKYADYIEH